MQTAVEGMAQFQPVLRRDDRLPASSQPVQHQDDILSASSGRRDDAGSQQLPRRVQSSRRGLSGEEEGQAAGESAIGRMDIGRLFRLSVEQDVADYSMERFRKALAADLQHFGERLIGDHQKSMEVLQTQLVRIERRIEETSTRMENRFTEPCLRSQLDAVDEMTDSYQGGGGSNGFPEGAANGTRENANDSDARANHHDVHAAVHSASAKLENSFTDHIAGVKDLLTDLHAAVKGHAPFSKHLLTDLEEEQQRLWVDPNNLHSDSDDIRKIVSMDHHHEEVLHHAEASTPDIRHDFTTNALYWCDPVLDDVMHTEGDVPHVAKKLQRRRWLNRVALTLVVLNTAFLGFQVDYEAKGRKYGEDRYDWIWPIDMGFTILFAIELAIRLCENGPYAFFFSSADVIWNRFDSVLITSALADFILSSLDYAILSVDFSGMRILRVFRVIRVARIIRSLRFVRDLRLMCAAILNSMLSMMWATVILLLVIYVFALIILQTIHVHWKNDVDIPADVDELYGDLKMTMRTLFEAVSGGNDWGGLLAPLASLSSAYEYLFVFYVILVVFGIMNILTAIFVENASSLLDIDHDLVIQDEISRDNYTIDAIKKLFRVADRDNRGVINAAALSEQLRQKEARVYLRVLGIDIGEINGLYKLLGLSNQEEVGISKFVNNMMKLRGQAKEVDAVRLLQDNRRLALRLSGFMMYVQDQFDQLANRTAPKGEARGLEAYINKARGMYDANRGQDSVPVPTHHPDTFDESPA